MPHAIVVEVREEEENDWTYASIHRRSIYLT